MPVAINVVIPGPLPVPPAHAITQLPGAVIAEANDRWMGGVALDTYPCSGVLGWDDCAVTSPAEEPKDDGVYPTGAAYDSFTAYAPITCSSFGQLDGAGLRERATRYLDAADHSAIEAEIWQAAWVANPNFSSDATDVTVSGAADIVRTIGELEAAYAASGLQGVLHMGPRAANLAAAFYLVAPDRAGTLRTVSRGTPVVVGDGYDTQAGPGTGAGADAEWVVISGPVEIRRGPVEIYGDPSQTLDHSTNTFVIRAERAVNVAYDPCGLSAALVDLTKTGAS